MIPRYTRPEMGRIWTEENRFRKWLDVEIAATETLAEAEMVLAAMILRISGSPRCEWECACCGAAAERELSPCEWLSSWVCSFPWE